MSYSDYLDYKAAYQTSPIILVGGAAGTGMLPIATFLNSQNFPGGITAPASASGDENWVSFNVLPGGSLIRVETAKYPFANMAVAANAVVTDVLNVSLEMLFPASATIPSTLRKGLMTGLISKLTNHISLGGYFSVSTPSFTYQTALLTDIVDGTEEGEGGQVQVRWIWNFEVPLLTSAQLSALQNVAMSTISNQTVNNGNPPGSNPVQTISNPASGISANIVPSAAGPAASIQPVNTGGAAGVSLSSVAPILPSGAAP